MPAFSQKYSPEQKQAVIAAILDGVPGQLGSGPLGQGNAKDGQQMTAKEAVKAAAEGRLPELPAFDMNLSTARNYAQEARRDRDGLVETKYDRRTPVDAHEQLVRRMLRIGDRMVTKLERTPVQSRVDPELARETAKAVREIGQLVRNLGATKGPGEGGSQGAGAKTETPAKPSGLIAQLAADAKKGEGPSEKRPVPQGTDGGPEAQAETGHEASTHPPRSTQGPTETGVRVAAEISSDAVLAGERARREAAQALLSGSTVAGTVTDGL